MFPPPAFVCVRPSPLLLYIQVCPVCFFPCQSKCCSHCFLYWNHFCQGLASTRPLFMYLGDQNIQNSPLSNEQVLFLFLFSLERRKSKGGNGADQKHPTTTGTRSRTEQQKPPQLFSPSLSTVQQNTFLPLFSPPLACVCGCAGHSSLRDGEKRREGNFLAQWTQGWKVPFCVEEQDFRFAKTRSYSKRLSLLSKSLFQSQGEKCGFFH